MTGLPLQQERIAPTTAQVKQAKTLLHQVPAASYEWTSEAGSRFLRYVEELAQMGVPTSWLAKQLGLDPNSLYATLSRHRTRNSTRKGNRANGRSE